METSWPQRVLRLRSCRTVRGERARPRRGRWRRRCWWHGGMAVTAEGVRGSANGCPHVHAPQVPRCHCAIEFALIPSKPGPNNMMLFNGPRVRMGLHWARRGTVVHRLHHITRHRIFAGPGMQVPACVASARPRCAGLLYASASSPGRSLSQSLGTRPTPCIHVSCAFCTRPAVRPGAWRRVPRRPGADVTRGVGGAVEGYGGRRLAGGAPAGPLQREGASKPFAFWQLSRHPGWVHVCRWQGGYCHGGAGKGITASKEAALHGSQRIHAGVTRPTRAPRSRPRRPQVSSSTHPVWLYQLTETVGKPLPRNFGPPRKIKMVWPERSDDKVRLAPVDRSCFMV